MTPQSPLPGEPVGPKETFIGQVAVTGEQPADSKPPVTTTAGLRPHVTDHDELIRQNAFVAAFSAPPSRSHTPRLVAALLVFVLFLTATSALAFNAASHKTAVKKPQQDTTAKVKTVPVKAAANTTKPAQTTAPVQQPVVTKPVQKSPVATKPVVQQPVSTPAWNTIPINNSGIFSYLYVGGRQYVNGSGVTATLTQASPRVDQGGSGTHHSLIEIAAQSTDGKQIVEIGWVVDRGMNGDDAPHLFVYHWYNGQTSCYNGCGFVSTSAVKPGSVVSSGTTGNYGIVRGSGGWHLIYNGADLGYYPDSLWGGTYTQFGLVQIFGEVATTNLATCIQMGNGIFGNAAGSARISNYALSGANAGPSLYPYVTAPDKYNYGSVSATGMNIGGPGTCG